MHSYTVHRTFGGSKPKLIFRLVVAMMLMTPLPQISLAGGNIDVFFAGGQSNAKQVWANAIQATLTASGDFSNPLVVHATQPGTAMLYWYTDQPGDCYREDFFNNTGTGPAGTLESVLDSIEANGDTYTFQGFFWFQGESDCRPEESAYYQQRFQGMLNELQTDLGMSTPIPYTLAVVDLDPDPFWDDPNHINGITREGVEGLRTEQIALGNLPNGSYVDTRGIPRKPFDLIEGVTDAWHLDDENLTLVGNQLAETYITTFTPEPGTMTVLACGGFLILRRKRT